MREFAAVDRVRARIAALRMSCSSAGSPAVATPVSEPAAADLRAALDAQAERIREAYRATCADLHAQLIAPHFVPSGWSPAQREAHRLYCAATDDARHMRDEALRRIAAQVPAAAADTAPEGQSTRERRQP